MPEAAPTRGARRRRRRWLVALIALLALVASAFVTLTRPAVLVALARGPLTRAMGGPVEIGSIRWLSIDRLEVRDLRLRAHGWAGPAGEVAHVQQAQVTIAPWSLLIGRLVATEIEIDAMLLRAAEIADDRGRFNLASLRPGPGGGSNTIRRALVKRLTVESGLVERDDTGMHWRLVGRTELAGDAYPLADDPDVVTFQLAPLDGRDGDDATILRGSWNERTLSFEVAVDDLDLDDDARAMLPTELRDVWDAFDFGGSVSRMTLAWAPGERVGASLEIEDVGMTFPDFGIEETWARVEEGGLMPALGLPRMQVTSGRIAVEDGRVILDRLKGSLGSTDSAIEAVPFELTFAADLRDIVGVDESAAIDESVQTDLIRSAPFELELRVSNFKLEEGGPAVELPRAVARVLADFGVLEWIADVRIRIARAAPRVDEVGELVPPAVRTSGTILIEQARGRYRRFPYPLEDAEANIEFEDDLVRINYLRGTGASGGSVVVTGTVLNPGRAAEVDVRINAPGVFMDETLLASFPDRVGTVIGRFFDRERANRMRAAGLVPDEATIAEARTSLERVRAELRDETLDPARRATLELELECLDRAVAAGAFTLGGELDLELRVQRPPGIDRKPDITGSISLGRVGMLLHDFPLPILVRDGEITLDRDGVSLGDGLRLTLPGGGDGLIAGRVRRDPDDRDAPMEPRLVFAAVKTPVTPALLAAIPLARNAGDELHDEWPGEARAMPARLIDALGVDGRMSVEGRVAWRDGEFNPEGKPAIGVWIDLELDDAVLRPTAAIGEFLARTGFVPPERFELIDASARVSISPDGVDLAHLAAHHDGGTIDATGFVPIGRAPNGDSAIPEPDERERDLELRFTSITLEEYLLNLLPDESIEEARALWERLDPRGRFDATVRWGGPVDQPPRTEVVARPRSIDLLMDGERVTLEHRAGDLRLTGSTVRFEALDVEMADAVGPAGRILIDGRYGRAVANESARPPEKDVEPIDLVGSVRTARFDSPIVREVLDLLGGDALIEPWRRFEPSGLFDARFQYRVARPEAPADFEFVVMPESIGATFDGVRVDAGVAPATRIVLGPDRVLLDPLVLETGTGRWSIDGRVLLDDEGVGMIGRGSVVASGLDEETRALLPPPMPLIVEALSFDAGSRFRLDDVRLNARWRRGDPVRRPVDYQFSGDLVLAGASFDVGPEVRDAHGTVAIDVRAVDGALLSATATMRDTDAIVLDRQLDDLQVDVSSGPDRIVRIDRIEAELGGGRLSGDATFDTRDRTWSARFDLDSGSLARLAERVPEAEEDPADSALSAASADRTVDPDANEPPAEPVDGRVLAHVTLAGDADDPTTRRGRGRIVIDRANLRAGALGMAIVQIAQFTPPTSSGIDFAETDFVIDGERLLLERILMSCATIDFVGDGVFSLPTFEVAARLAPLGRLPIIREVVGSLSSAIYAIEVRGTLDEPDVRVTPLPGFIRKPTIMDPSGSSAESPIDPGGDVRTSPEK